MKVFRYMREHYGLDRLVDYATEEIPDTTKVVNQEYRRLDGQMRSLRGQLARKLAAFSAMGLKGEIEPKKVAAFEQKKAALQEQIDDLTKALDELTAQRKAIEHHITIAELPEEERFKHEQKRYAFCTPWGCAKRRIGGVIGENIDNQTPLDLLGSARRASDICGLTLRLPP
jgi:phage-related minor tail protein